MTEIGATELCGAGFSNVDYFYETAAQRLFGQWRRLDEGFG
ncbi:hypothetical protein ACIO3O_02495 [Streptomyces sp. NPDC087440]